MLDPLAMRRSSTKAASSAGTGIERWWSYEERAIPGIGRAMLNVGSGNLVVSAMDVDVPEQGIDLAFQRVYNSQSLHNAGGGDGGNPSIFGNGWTNNIDANIIYDSNANTITVYDIDGAACTYTANGDGTWKPCAGQYATLTPVPQSGDCSYDWTKKNGTVYVFHTNLTGVGCSIAEAKLGHLENIFSRNHNNFLSFAYSYNGEGTTSQDITEIDVTHSHGDVLKLKFGLIAGTKIKELARIERPDGATLAYRYDTSGNLVEVDKPGNDSAGTVTPPPDRPDWPKGDVPETYAYAAGSSAMQAACGPRCTVAMWKEPNNPKDGSALLFAYNGSSQLSRWEVQGVMNFTPPDGTNTPVHPEASTEFVTWYRAEFVYGHASACSTSGDSNTTTMCDSDGHATIWTLNDKNNVTQTQDWTGTAEGVWLVTKAGWDANNLISTTDAKGNKTKYAYDTPGHNQGGNLVEMQQAQAGDITDGPLSPLSTYSFDQHNNVIAYCDPVYNQTHGNSWVDSPPDHLCPSASGAARFSFNGADQNEPFGCLTTIQKPSDYGTAISYPSAPGACGFGLPIKTLGDTITQYDNTTRKPLQRFGYDSHGNLTSYDKGTGNSGRLLDFWTLVYDAQHLLTRTTEHDSLIPLSVSSFTCHFLDGSVFYTETPAQHEADNDPSCPGRTALEDGNVTPPKKATSYSYDLDGDQVKMITHKGCSSNTPCPAASTTNACATSDSEPIGTTCKYYDGLDRLVETIEPYDRGRSMQDSSGGKQPYELYLFRWMNRYIYDLSQHGGSAKLTISDTTGTISGLVAYGNLYKTQEFLPQMPEMIAKLDHPQYEQKDAGWSDVRGTSFDGLDRPIGKYELAFGTSAVTTNWYDTNDQLGLLNKVINAVGQQTNYTYDSIQRVRKTNFSGTAPLADGRSYTYDADGRIATAQNAMGTLTNAYDVDGNTLSVTEPNLQPSQPNGAAMICYAYYGDGLRKYLSIGPADVGKCSEIKPNMSPANGGISQPDIFSYAYRVDGLLAKQLVNWGAQETFKWTYAPSGRELTQTDPLTGGTVSYPPVPVRNPTTLVEKSYAYDHHGRVKHLTFPEGFQLSKHVYDLDDELSGYEYGGDTGTIRYLTLNARGELLEDHVSNTLFGWAQGPSYSANGAQVGNGTCLCSGIPLQAPPTTLQFDERSNMAVCAVNPQWALGITGLFRYKYDAAGRQVAAGHGPNGGQCSPADATAPTSYDAENHIKSTENIWLVSDNPLPGESAGSVQWGPDGRHRVDNITTSGETSPTTAHWDGDTLLFQTPGPFLYVGKLAIMDTAGEILISDRDQ
ncbi:MAG: DUF6531 domain-containing protein, partial [Candidatus Cybelea sp.]